jgi:hypothetical protein
MEAILAAIRATNLPTTGGKMIADASPIGFLYGLAVILLWMLILVVPAVSIGAASAGAFVFGPLALVERRANHRWPSWASRVLGFSVAGAVIAVPSLWLLIRVASE